MTTIIARPYTIADQSFVVSAPGDFGHTSLLADHWDEAMREALAQFSTDLSRLQVRLAWFERLERPLTRQEKYELSSILQALTRLQDALHSFGKNT